MSSSGSLPWKISVSAMMAALVCVATVAFQVYIPETHGYFNIGEVAVYISAILFGPVVGGVAGGFGSALADIITGYGYYAPGTFVIKGFEGLIVGFLSFYFRKFTSKMFWRTVILLFAFITSSLIFYIGSTYYSGLMELSLGFPYLGYHTFVIDIPWIFWAFPSAFLLIFLLYISFRVDVETSGSIVAALIGGSEMVLGYFLYEFHALSFGWAALAEVPFNICQMLVGIIVSIPVAKSVSKYFKFG